MPTTSTSIEQTLPRVGLVFVLYFGAAVAFGDLAYADKPFLPPADYEVRSSNGECLARANVAQSRIAGFRAVDQDRKELWVIPEYHQFIKLGDDCRSAMALYEGESSLWPEDRQPSTVVLSLFHSGELARRVTLGELYSDLHVLPETVSHYSWVEETGWKDGSGLSIRSTVERSFSIPSQGKG